MRKWSDRYYKLVLDRYDAGIGWHFDVYDKSPRVGGRKVGMIELITRPCQISLARLLSIGRSKDGARYLRHVVYREGGLWNDIDHFVVWYEDKYKVSRAELLTEINFKLV